MIDVVRVKSGKIIPHVSASRLRQSVVTVTLTLLRAGELVLVPREGGSRCRPPVELDVILAGQSVHVILAAVCVILVSVVVLETMMIRPSWRIAAEKLLAVPQISCGGQPTLIRAPVDFDGVDVALGAAHQLVHVARLDPEVGLVLV